MERQGCLSAEKVDKKVYRSTGLFRTAIGSTFLQVFDAGHMVPADQPENALEMIHNFVNGGDF
jgi:carboxypeptidase C (cathepsin A)